MSLPKPATPVLNLASPFATGLVYLIPFSEGTGTPAVLVGPDGSGTPTLTLVGSPTWTTNSDGAALACATTDYVKFTGLADPATTAVTIALIRRKTDATLRNSGLFGQEAASTTARRGGASAPKADGIVSWWWGGSTSPNLLTVSGLSFGTTVEQYIFTAGAAGSTIWQTGTKVATQATGISRTSGGGVLSMNRGLESGVTTGDAQELNYFAIYDVQWDDATCAAWSANPYAVLYPATTAHRSGFGAQKPSRRQQGRRV